MKKILSILLLCFFVFVLIANFPIVYAEFDLAVVTLETDNSTNTTKTESTQAETVSLWSYADHNEGVPEETTHHPLFKYTVRLYMSDRLVSNIVIVFNDQGLPKTVQADDTSADFSYQFDIKGNPERIHVLADNGDEYTIDLKNTYYGKELIEVQITGKIESDESANTLLGLLANYVGYANATLRVKNSDAQIRISDGKIVYSSGNYGYLIEMSYIYQQDGTKIEITKSTAPNGSYTTETCTYNAKGQLVERKEEQIDSNQNYSYQLYHLSYNTELSAENSKALMCGRITKADYSDENERITDNLPSNYSIMYTYGKHGTLESCEISIDYLDYVVKKEYDVYGNVVHMETRSGDYLTVDDYQYYDCSDHQDKTISITVIHGDGRKKDFTFLTESKYLLGALEQENIVRGTATEYGYYVETVDEETANDDLQQWWMISKNGKGAETEVNKIEISNGDHYEISLITGW